MYHVLMSIITIMIMGKTEYETSGASWELKIRNEIHTNKVSH